MTDALIDSNIIFCEMMSHPALFAHPHPKKISIVGDETQSILNEALKHPEITEVHHIKNQSTSHSDTRIKAYSDIEWNKISIPNSLDIIINLNEATEVSLQQHFNLLHHDGILLQASTSPFYPEKLKLITQQLKTVGFSDLHILNFPQPDYPSGWRTAIIALKHGIFKRLREKVIFNKPFKTQYYNFDIHRASMVLPEFMREII